MVSNRFIFVDLGRCGGTVVRNYLHQAPGLKWLEVTAHLPLSATRRLAPGVPTFAYMRHPLDWYLAYWHRDLEIHRWRGGFEDWFWYRRHVDGSRGACMSKEWHYMTDPGVDYIGFFENLVENTAVILSAVAPDLFSVESVRVNIQPYLRWSYGVQHIEGVAQWSRELYTLAMIDKVLEQDKDLFDLFGYEIDEYFWFPGGCGKSAHVDVEVSNWEQEKGLANWCTRPLNVLSGRPEHGSTDD